MQILPVMCQPCDLGAFSQFFWALVYPCNRERMIPTYSGVMMNKLYNVCKHLNSMPVIKLTMNNRYNYCIKYSCSVLKTNRHN